MKKGQNYNRPKKGSQIKVEPIKKKRDIESIKKMLSDNPRNQALFTIGINTNLRASDLLSIKAGQVRELKPGCNHRFNSKPILPVEIDTKGTGKTIPFYSEGKEVISI